MVLAALARCCSRSLRSRSVECTRTRTRFARARARPSAGGKGTPRRKVVKKSQSASQGDDRKIQAVLKKLNVTAVSGVEEVNMFKEDGNVLHFQAPRGESKRNPSEPAGRGRASVLLSTIHPPHRHCRRRGRAGFLSSPFHSSSSTRTSPPRMRGASPSVPPLLSTGVRASHLSLPLSRGVRRAFAACFHHQPLHPDSVGRGHTGISAPQPGRSLSLSGPTIPIPILITLISKLDGRATAASHPPGRAAECNKVSHCHFLNDGDEGYPLSRCKGTPGPRPEPQVLRRRRQRLSGRPPFTNREDTGERRRADQTRRDFPALPIRAIIPFVSCHPGHATTTPDWSLHQSRLPLLTSTVGRYVGVGKDYAAFLWSLPGPRV